MAHKLGLLMLAGLGLANAHQIHVDNCADSNAFGCEKPIVSFKPSHHDDDHDHVHLLGEKEVALGWEADHHHVEKVLHEKKEDHKGDHKGGHKDDDAYGHIHAGPLYYYYYPGSRYYYTRSDYGYKGWVRHAHAKDHEHPIRVVKEVKDHHDDDHSHVVLDADHHSVIHSHPHAHLKPAMVSAKPAVLAVAEVSKVPKGAKAVPVQIIHTYDHFEPIPGIDFEPTDQKPVLLSEGQIKSPVGIVSVPNVATVHFDEYHPSPNERLGRSDCPECDTEKDARRQKKYADKKLRQYKDKLSTEIEGPIEDVSAYAKDHEHFYLHTHEFDDCPHPHDVPHIHALGPHRYLHHHGKVYFYDHSSDHHHAAQHSGEHGHEHLATHHYEPAKDYYHEKAHAYAEAVKRHKEAIQYHEIAHDLAKGQAREDAAFKVGEVNFLEPAPVKVKHDVIYHDHPHYHH